jgi:hypothetical protein
MQTQQPQNIHPILFIFEILRVSLVMTGFFLAYPIEPSSLKMIMTFVLIPMTGLTALENLFFPLKSAQGTGGISNDYQKQSAMHNLATCITAALILWLNWGRGAELAIVFLGLLFFFLSGIKHAYEYWIDHKERIHLFRWIGSLLIVVAVSPIVMDALPKM